MLEARIPATEIQLEFIRASGPGGQNVNKTSTKVRLSWQPSTSAAFSEAEKALILDHLHRYLTSDGWIVLTASSQRSQLQNRASVVARLERLVSLALVPAVPRVPTRPSYGSKVKRLQTKQKRGRLKKLRKLATDD